jgi:hypothetical protein
VERKEVHPVDTSVASERLMNTVQTSRKTGIFVNDGALLLVVPLSDSYHADLAANTGVKDYFSDPHSRWQRGNCEITNGLLRQSLPKGCDLSIYSQDELDTIADCLNNRPRATRDFNAPLAVFAQMLAMAQLPSTSNQKTVRLGLESAKANNQKSL